MTSLISPVEFPVTVNGQMLTATILEELSNAVQWVYRVRFSDGFEDIFIMGDEGICGEKETSAPYVQGLLPDIACMFGLDAEKFFHVFQDEIDGKKINIWVIEQEESGEIFYAVHYDSRYRFDLKGKPNAWQAFAISEKNKDINSKISSRACSMLDSLL